MTTEPEVLTTPIEAGATQDESQVEGALTKLALASIGAVSLAEEAAENLLRHLVARGETDWNKARGVLARVRRPRLPRPPRPVLAIRAGTLASKADVQALNARLDGLSAQIETLSKGPAEGA